MTEYETLLKQRDALDARIQEARAAAIAEVKILIVTHGITAEDLGVQGRRKVGRPRSSEPLQRRAEVPIKYRDPNSGKTWNGLARMPKWLADAPNRDVFLVP